MDSSSEKTKSSYLKGVTSFHLTLRGLVDLDDLESITVYLSEYSKPKKVSIPAMFVFPILTTWLLFLSVTLIPGHPIKPVGVFWYISTPVNPRLFNGAGAVCNVDTELSMDSSSEKTKSSYAKKVLDFHSTSSCTVDLDRIVNTTLKRPISRLKKVHTPARFVHPILIS